ncbi:hypothetical protein [Thermococcus sp.]
MECIIVREITDVIIGVIMIAGFFSRKFHAMYQVPLSPVAGSLFVGTSIIELIFRVHVEFLEFFAALILLFMIERFIKVNTKKPFNWYYLIIIMSFTVITVLISRNIWYFHAGVLLTLGTVPARIGRNMGPFHWPYRGMFYLSAVFGFLAVGAYLISLCILSDFLYFGGVVLFLSMIPELAPTG